MMANLFAKTDLTFSAYERSAIVKQLAKEKFDLLVIGGGITGAGIALDAASRGLRTALVEKNDFAYGTSSRSTKLIHGGLRYLKQLEFALVKEVGSERAIVHRLAPHLVVPEKMLLPLYEKRGLGYWLTSIGLKIYDWLAGVTANDQRKMLTKSQTLKFEPLLRADEVKGGAIYAEYRTDDARLTIEIAKAAAAHDAVIGNYVTVEDFVYEGNSIVGVKATDTLSGTKFSVAAHVVVNAAGPWVDNLRTRDGSRSGKQLHLTKGVHIVVPYHTLPVRQAIYFDVPDGRMIFAIPRGRVTYVGTTDTDYTGHQDEVCTTIDDARYLLQGINSTFPGINLTLADIESSWAGLRPLIHEDGKSASELSRKDEIFVSPSGLISIAGGKLTGYRKMAERVVDLVIDRHFANRTLKQCHTHAIALAGGLIQSAAQTIEYRDEVWTKIQALGLKSEDAAALVHLYGKQTDDILSIMPLLQGESAEVSLLMSEINYAVEHEMVMKASDFFVRRTGLLYFNLPKMVSLLEPGLQHMQTLLHWDNARLHDERAAMNNLIEMATGFKSQQ